MTSEGSLLQAINKPPNARARISAFGRATLFVHPVESLRFLLGFRVALNQFRERLFDKGLAIYQTQILTTPLNRMAVDVCRLRSYVKHKPELKAWIRGSRLYPAVTSLSDSPFEVGMLVAVKDAPDLVEPVVRVCSPIPPDLVSSLLNERHWRRRTCGADVETHSRPSHDVQILWLGNASFCVDSNDGALLSESNSPPRSAGPSFPATSCLVSPRRQCAPPSA